MSKSNVKKYVYILKRILLDSRQFNYKFFRLNGPERGRTADLMLAKHALSQTELQAPSFSYQWPCPERLLITNQARGAGPSIGPSHVITGLEACSG